jgi:NADH-ubiquinone oxidoreductase chain 6
MTNLILYLLAIFIILTSVLVVTATSPVLSVLYIVGLFLLTALYIIMSGLPFAGLVYLVVYVGAVAVLFLFVVMMLNVPLSAYNTADSVRSVPLVGILASLFITSFVLVSDYNTAALNLTQVNTTGINQAQTLASELFTHDALILILVGLVLLLAIIGPVSMSMDHDAENIRQLREKS